jgi:hypothetical protein
MQQVPPPEDQPDRRAACVAGARIMVNPLTHRLLADHGWSSFVTSSMGYLT